MKPIYISAYFFICLVPFTIFVAFCIDAIKLQWVKVSFITIVLLLSFIRLYGWYTNSKTSGLVIRNYYEDYKGTAAFLTLHASSSDAIIFLPSSVQKDVDFYIQKQHILNEIDLQPNSGDSAETIDQNKFHALTSRYSRVWYVLETVTSNRVDKENVLITKYLSKSYKLKNVYTLDAMTIFDYTK